MNKIYAAIEYLYQKMASVLHLLELEDQSRKKILARFPPKFPRVVAKHCTYYYGADEKFEIPDIKKIRVIGYASDDHLEAAVCEVNDKLISPDKRIFHITISLDPKYRETHHANDILNSGKWESTAPFTVKVRPVKKSM